MNTASLKAYAPAARNAFRAAVTAQAARYGITAAGTSTTQVSGDVLLIEGQAFPKSIAGARAKLSQRVRDQGFGPPAWFREQVARRMAHQHTLRRREQLRQWRAELRRKAQEERRAMEQDRAESGHRRRVEMQHDYLDRIVRNLRGEIASFILDD